MAGDLDLLLGKWTVKVKGWTWEYEFQAGGRVSWRDVNSHEKGSGNWATSSTLVNMWWQGSTTRESWQRPLTASTDRTWYQAPYYQGKYHIEKAGVAPPAPTPTPVETDQHMIDTAWDASRKSLRFALDRLKRMQTEILMVFANAMDASALETHFRRDIAVISWKLLVPRDAMSPEFRSALSRTVDLIEANLRLPKTLVISRTAGKCANPLRAFAWTSGLQQPPDTELCTPWVEAGAFLRRDVITHEYFHVIGLKDISVSTTDEALDNANTVAQVVAFIADRTRQANSDGHEPAVPPLPTP